MAARKRSTSRPVLRGSQRQHEHRPATAAELDAAAACSPADIPHADATWQRNAPGALRRLLQAQPVTPTGPTTPRGRTSST